MSSIAESSDVLTSVLNEQARSLARETGLIQRERPFDGADLAQSLIFGWLAEPAITLEGLCQVLGRREVQISAAGLSQRFSQSCAEFFLRLLEVLGQQRLQAEEQASYPLLRPFTAGIVEDSSIISLPADLAEVWRGCGGRLGASEGGVKL